jgi:plastocyanin
MRLSFPTAAALPFLLTAALLAFAALAAARADEPAEATLSIKDHKFDPPELVVPAGRAIRLTVKNLDDTAEEFESHPLEIEKVIAGKQDAIVRLKPLDKGSYLFFGEYHEDTAQGMVTAE